MKEALEILQTKDLDQQSKTIKVYHENEIKQIQGAQTLMARFIYFVYPDFIKFSPLIYLV